MRYNFRRYCKDCENIENYEKAKADDFKGWEVHHRLETHNSDGERRPVDIARKELIALDMYYNRPSSELIFLTVSEHRLLHNEGEHNPFYGKKHSDETIRKISLAQKGMHHHSEEAKKKMSEALKGKPKSEEHKKKLSEALKGKHLGKDNSFYGKTHSEETKKKLSEINKVKMKGMRFFNNGKINIRAKECPDGFVPGRIKKL